MTLEADAAAAVEELLVVLVVVVQVVLGLQDGLDHLDGGRARRLLLHGGHVGEAPDAAGDVAGRRALEGRHHTDDVAVALRGDVDHLEGALVHLAERRLRRLRDHLPEEPVAGDDHEPHRVDRGGRPGREHRALHAPLPAVGQEGAEVGERPELRLVDGGLGPCGQRLAHLGDDEADVVGRHLDPRVALHAEEGPQLEAKARHQQLGLVPRLAVQGHELVGVEALAQALGDEAHLGRPDGVEAAQRAEEDDEDRHSHHDQHRHDDPPPANTSASPTIT
jgi:hypothetical protein